MHTNKLTLVIPTYNRQKIVLRAIRYWAEIGVTVHILDGSKNAIDNIDNIIKGECIFYHHIPISFLERLKFSIDLINTKYCALCGDDEFYLKSSINTAIENLENNNELVACAGRAAGMSFSSKKLFLKNTYPEQKNYSVNQDNSCERMLYHMRNYSPSTIYSIVRKDAWINAMRVSTIKDYPIAALFEIQFEMILALHGKSIVTNNLHWLRNFDTELIRDTDLCMSSINNFARWWSDPINKSKIDIIINDMIYLIDIRKVNKTVNLHETIKKSFDNYYKFDREIYSFKMYIYRVAKKILGFNEFIEYTEYINKYYSVENNVTLMELNKIELLLNKF